MKKGLYKDFKREIHNTRGRFLSILLIVSLGVAFFSGIRASEPDMRLSADRYFDRECLMDVSVISDKGLTRQDLKAVEKVPGVKSVFPRYRLDALLKNGERSDVIRIYSFLEDINKVKLVRGQKPQKDTECLLDDAYMKERKLKVGDSVTVKGGGKKKISDSLKNTTFVISGSCASPEYISFGRGAATIGNGEVSGFMFIDAGVFKSPVYGELCLESAKAREKVAFTQAYKKEVRNTQRAVKDIAKERCLLREEDLRTQAHNTIQKERETLLEKKAEATERFSEAEEKLRAGEEKIQSAERDIEKGRNEIRTGESALREKENLMVQKEKDLEEAEKALKDKEKPLLEKETLLKNKKAEILKGERRLKEQTAESQKVFQEKKEKIQSGLKEMAEARAHLEALQAKEHPTPEEISLMAALQETLKGEAPLKEGLRQLEETEKETEKTLAAEREKIDAAKKQIAEAEKQLQDGKEKVAQGRRDLKAGREKLLEGQRALEQGKKDLSAHKAEMENGAEKLAKEKTDVKAAREALEKEKAEAFAKIQDGFERLDSEQEKLDKKNLSATWYVKTRDALPDYTGYGDNADRMGAVGKAFPVLFFLVAALISLTTMTRLVEEERMQIGTMKALGYKKRLIAGKYLWYAFFATFLGSVLGVLFGEKVFPAVIVSSYKILYPYMPDGVYPYQMRFAFMASLVALLCTLGGAGLASWRSLRAEPATLMRPPVPKAGKRILLERMPFFWNRLSFTWKATFRNLIRYKKRFFMTVFGIGGCMALMLVGYGIRDSITEVKEKQYTELVKYDAAVFLDNLATDYDREKIQQLMDEEGDLKESSKLYFKKAEVKKGKEKREVYISVVKDDKTLKNFVTLRTRKTPEHLLAMPKEGVILSEKLAKVLRVKKGDRVTIKNRKVKVQAICENYVGHFAYMSENTYEKLMGEKPKQNLIYIKTE